MLLYGVWKYGLNNWADLRDDPELGLAEKISVDDQGDPLKVKASILERRVISLLKAYRMTSDYRRKKEPKKSQEADGSNPLKKQKLERKKRVKAGEEDGELIETDEEQLPAESPAESEEFEIPKKRGPGRPKGSGKKDPNAPPKPKGTPKGKKKDQKIPAKGKSPKKEMAEEPLSEGEIDQALIPSIKKLLANANKSLESLSSLKQRSDIERQEKVSKTKKYLLSIGGEIEAILARDPIPIPVANKKILEQHLWYYASTFTEITGAAIRRLYNKLCKNPKKENETNGKDAAKGEGNLGPLKIRIKGGAITMNTAILPTHPADISHGNPSSPPNHHNTPPHSHSSTHTSSSRQNSQLSTPISTSLADPHYYDNSTRSFSNTSSKDGGMYSKDRSPYARDRNSTTPRADKTTGRDFYNRTPPSALTNDFKRRRDDDSSSDLSSPPYYTNKPR
eukprot:TRINITY_DN1644_c0_g1_i1.p1 TRINITY_DN1644_c0_g1~~TRINITY_DN1644_c0_g1_i1.p1  ORF type:complete len:450 (+),score=124.54 TRINITY_DN1644_c0_g1_i1:105-1454(+)